MWNYLVSFSTWAENNSGQIQILIAVVALWLAIKGYKKVLEQIAISRDQEIKANNQKGYELKIQSLNLLLTVIERNHVTQKNLYAIVERLERSVPPYNNNECINAEEVKQTIESTKKKIESIQEIQQHIIKLCEDINKIESISQATIKQLNELLLKATKDANSYDLIHQAFSAMQLD